MIGIVKLALRRPYTFTVMALLITIFAIMPSDVLQHHHTSID
jgi:hypothetical protein